MKNLQNLLLLSLVSGLLLSSCTKEKKKLLSGYVTTENFYSNTVGDGYKIYIYIPSEFDTSKTYDVIFQLDANYQFDSLAWMMEGLFNVKNITPKILIGIGYYGQDQRDRDYTISEVSGSQSGAGGASKFYDFIITELIPHIDSNFKITDNHTIVGHSLGGLFVYYSLLQQDRYATSFKNFIAQSPSLWWDGAKIFEMIPDNQILNGKLYSNVGQYENSTMRSLSTEMLKRMSNNPNLKTKFSIIAKASHTDTKIQNREAYEFIFN